LDNVASKLKQALKTWNFKEANHIEWFFQKHPTTFESFLFLDVICNQYPNVDPDLLEREKWKALQDRAKKANIFFNPRPITKKLFLQTCLKLHPDLNLQNRPKLGQTLQNCVHLLCNEEPWSVSEVRQIEVENFAEFVSGQISLMWIRFAKQEEKKGHNLAKKAKFPCKFYTDNVEYFNETIDVRPTAPSQEDFSDGEDDVVCEKAIDMNHGESNQDQDACEDDPLAIL